MTFPSDPESGNNPRNYTRFTLAFLKARYRSLVGDSNAANKVPLLIQGAPSQTANLVEIYDSSKNGLFAIGPDGGIISGGVQLVAQKVAQVALTAAQIITGNSVPVPLVAAPGAGLVLVAKACYYQFKYGTTQMTTSTGVTSPVYHGATTNLLSGSVAATTIKAAASSFTSMGGPAASLACSVNTGIDLLTASADFAAGDSTAIVTLFYDVVTEG
jgi:hypothetical protein